MEGAKKFFKGSIVRYMHKGVMNKTGVCMRLMNSVTAEGWQVRWSHVHGHQSWGK